MAKIGAYTHNITTKGSTPHIKMIHARISNMGGTGIKAPKFKAPKVAKGKAVKVTI